MSYTDEFQNKMHKTTYSHSTKISQQNTRTNNYKYILNNNLFIKHTIKLHTNAKLSFSYALQTYYIYSMHQPL